MITVYTSTSKRDCHVTSLLAMTVLMCYTQINVVRERWECQALSERCRNHRGFRPTAVRKGFLTAQENRQGQALPLRAELVRCRNRGSSDLRLRAELVRCRNPCSCDVKKRRTGTYAAHSKVLFLTTLTPKNIIARNEVTWQSLVAETVARLRSPRPPKADSR